VYGHLIEVEREIYIIIYTHMLAPLKSIFDAFPETCMIKLTANFNKLCSEFDHADFVSPLKKQYPYNI